MEKSANSGYKFIIFVLVLVLGGMMYWYMREVTQWERMSTQMEQERDSISMRLSDMLQAYSTLKTNNEELKLQLEGEKEKINGLMAKMRSKEKLYYADIRRYEQEANTLRSIMRNYIHQIDSLNTLSQRLIVENREVKRNLKDTREQNKKLEEEKQSLSSQVEKGAVIRVREVEGEALNSREKSTNRASRTHKLKVCFTINENVVAAAGTRYVYITIADPSKKLLENSDGETFALRDGESQLFSAKREVDYQNQDLETCLYFDTQKYFDAQKTKMAEGAYTIEVYIDGNHSGSGQLVLK